MTDTMRDAFELFQAATTLIAEGDHERAGFCLRCAIATIDATGEDVHMRADLVALCHRISHFHGSK